MSAKMTLDVAAMKEDFFSDTALIGIVTALPVYRFCWLLNRKFDLDFVRDTQTDIVLQDAKRQEHFFPLYKYCSPFSGCNYTIYKLKSEKEFLLPEVKQLDYLWSIQSNSPEADAEVLIRYLREIPDVQLAQKIESERLKNLNNLLV